MEQENKETIVERLRNADEGLDLLGRDCRIFPPPVMVKDTNLGESSCIGTPCYPATYYYTEVMGYSQDIALVRIKRQEPNCESDN